MVRINWQKFVYIQQVVRSLIRLQLRMFPTLFVPLMLRDPDSMAVYGRPDTLNIGFQQVCYYKDEKLMQPLHYRPNLDHGTLRGIFRHFSTFFGIFSPNDGKYLTNEFFYTQLWRTTVPERVEISASNLDML